MASSDFDFVSFLLRWLFAAALVFGTYNPTDISYISWVTGEGVEFGPIPALIGVVILIAWIIFLRATYLSMGPLGIVLGAALFGCIIWLFVDLGWLHVDSASSMTWLALLLLSLILAMGMSWSHIRRRMTGHVAVDDVEE